MIVHSFKCTECREEYPTRLEAKACAILDGAPLDLPRFDFAKRIGHDGPCFAEPRDTPVSVYDDVAAERARADQTHGVHSIENPAMPPLVRLSVLLEEVGEVAHELNEAILANQGRSMDTTALRAELIQVAACAVAWADVL